MFSVRCSLGVVCVLGVWGVGVVRERFWVFGIRRGVGVFRKFSFWGWCVWEVLLDLCLCFVRGSVFFFCL